MCCAAPPTGDFYISPITGEDMQTYASLVLPKRRPAPVPINISIDGEEALLLPPAPFDYFNNYYWMWNNYWQWWSQTPIVVEMTLAGDDL